MKNQTNISNEEIIAEVRNEVNSLMSDLPLFQM